MSDDPRGAMYLLSFGRSAEEKFDLLRRLGCLSPSGLANRLAVVLLLDRVYQEHVDSGQPPVNPIPQTRADLVRMGEPWPMPPGSGEMPYQVLARRQRTALVEAGYLNAAACRVDDVRTWWEAVLPVVAEVRDAHNPIFAAIAPQPPPPPPPRPPIDPAATLVPAPPGPPPPRTDPVTCTACGRPFPRAANFCVWCGHRR